MGDIQGRREEYIFHILDQLKRAEILAACVLGCINIILFWNSRVAAAVHEPDTRIQLGMMFNNPLFWVGLKLEEYMTAVWGLDYWEEVC